MHQLTRPQPNPPGCRICGSTTSELNLDRVCFHWVTRSDGIKVPDEYNPCSAFAFWQQKYGWRLRADKVVNTPLDGPMPSPSTGDPYALRYLGVHYTARPGIVRERNSFLGFGGAVFNITIDKGPQAGVAFQCNDVWSQGPIPLEWALFLPDNAIVREAPRAPLTS